MSPRALELRIHGVNNTPPAAMLGLSTYEVAPTRGDRFGGFWAPRQPNDRLRTEAYSWGGMARSGPSMPGGRAPWVNVLARIGWALLLPFGLANVAYWSRKLPIGKQRPDWRCGRGAATTRLFGLGLTVLLVLAMCEIALNLLAIQCAPAGACTRLPVTWFSALDVPTRVAVASAGPVVLLLGLWLLTTLSRMRYERTVTHRGRTDRGAVMLADPDLWRGDVMLRGLTRIHLATGFAVVALVSAVDAWSSSWVFRVLAVVAAALVLAGCAVVSRRVADAPDVESASSSSVDSWLLLGFAVATLVGEGVSLLVFKPALTAPLVVTTWAPPVVLACLLGIVVSALAWRARPGRVPMLLGFVVAAGLVATRWHWAGAVVAVAVGGVLFWFARKGEQRDWQAWLGTGPFVLLGLSLTASLTLSTVAVVATGDWLLGVPNTSSVYVWFSGAFIVALAPLVLALLALAVLAGSRMIRPALLGPEGIALDVRARHVAALAHRAEKVVGLLALFGVLALALAVESTLSGGHIPQLVVDYGLEYTIAAGVAVVGMFVGARTTRPLGIVWDLICFLPRTAHPFAPPCYAERAVPELVARTREWLDEGPDNRVVLSAHSLGCVLAAATVYAMPEEDLPRLRLITYGSQLRPFFGRIFPELLGPVVLGTPPCRGGRLWSRSPWRGSSTNGAGGGLSTMVRWTNLWRWTDFLGFPAHGYADNDCDRQTADSNGSGRIQWHSGYQTSTEYQVALTSHLD